MSEAFYIDSVQLLKTMISTPSLSKEEDEVCTKICSFLEEQGLSFTRDQNNIILKSPHWKRRKPVVLLNSHIDTVKASDKWTKPPFGAMVEDDRLYGLGSNDAGASVVSLLAAFRTLIEKEQAYNLMLVISAEEEISGQNGIASVLNKLPKIDFGIVGEPTQMQMAVAEKGLMVLDCTAHGKPGHAARDEGDNAIYKALLDVEWFKCFVFPEPSNYLGNVKMSVTQIEAGSQHNVVPDQCKFVVDVRTTDRYSNHEIIEIINEHVSCEVKPRSTRLNSSFTPQDHPFVIKGSELGLSTYGSPTLSDQALMAFPTVKIGPGNSARSHTADEFIKLEEIKEAIALYVQLLDGLSL